MLLFWCHYIRCFVYFVIFFSDSLLLFIRKHWNNQTNQKLISPRGWPRVRRWNRKARGSFRTSSAGTGNMTPQTNQSDLKRWRHVMRCSTWPPGVTVQLMKPKLTLHLFDLPLPRDASGLEILKISLELDPFLGFEKKKEEKCWEPKTKTIKDGILSFFSLSLSLWPSSSSLCRRTTSCLFLFPKLLQTYPQTPEPPWEEARDRVMHLPNHWLIDWSITWLTDCVLAWLIH